MNQFPHINFCLKKERNISSLMVLVLAMETDMDTNKSSWYLTSYCNRISFCLILHFIDLIHVKNIISSKYLYCKWIIAFYVVIHAQFLFILKEQVFFWAHFNIKFTLKIFRKRQRVRSWWRRSITRWTSSRKITLGCSTPTTTMSVTGWTQPN